MFLAYSEKRRAERNHYKMCQNLKQLTPVELSEVWETEPQHFTRGLQKRKI